MDWRSFTTYGHVMLCITHLAVLSLSGALFEWKAPPPAWNQTIPGTLHIQTAVIPVLNGSENYPLRWSYSLHPSQSITFAFLAIKYGSSQPDTIGYVLSGNPAVINNRHDYQTRFRIESTRDYSTLTIQNVNQREQATFQCKLQVGRNTWAYNARIVVTGTAIQLKVLVEKLNGSEAEYQKEYDDLNSAHAKKFVDEFVNEIGKVYVNDTLYEKAEVNGLRRGSIIVYLKIYFKRAVTTTEGLATLRNVIGGGTVGRFTVRTIKIVQGEVHPNTPPVTKTAFSEATTPGRETSTAPVTRNPTKSSTPVSLGNDGNEVPVKSKSIIIGCSVEVLLLLLCLSCYVQVRVI